jgi:hypothetical protein
MGLGWLDWMLIAYLGVCVLIPTVILIAVVHEIAMERFDAYRSRRPSSQSFAEALAERTS